MLKKIVRSSFVVMIVVSLLLVSCGPQAAPEPAPSPAPVPGAPAPGTPAPVTPTPAPAPAPENAISVTLKKLDGTTMTKQVEKPQYGGTLRMLAFAAPWRGNPLGKTTHPAVKSTLLASEQLVSGDWARGPAGTGELSWQIYEILTIDQFTGRLAESWEITGDSVIFHLRKGVRFALDDREASKLVGGREMTADDVVASFRATVDKTVLMYDRAFADFRGGDVDFRATDKYTVVVKAPVQYLRNVVAKTAETIPILPVEIINKYGGFEHWSQMVGTGPFIIKDRVEGATQTWVKNPGYWGRDPVLGEDYPLPYVDSLVEFEIPDQSTQDAAMRTGKLDGTLNRTKEAWESLSRTAPFLKVKIANFGTSGQRFQFQMNNSKAPWQDIRVRQALMLAIDHRGIIDSYYEGAADFQARPIVRSPEVYGFGWIVPDDQLPQETKELYEYHPDKAKQLLSEAGYPNGFKTSVLINSTGAEFIDVASIVKEQWAKVGVELVLDIKESGVYAGYWNRRDFPEMLALGGWAYTLEYTCCSSRSTGNVGNVDDPVTTGLIDDMFGAYWDLEKRTPIMRELYLRTLSQVYEVALPSKWTYQAYAPWVKNYDAEASLGYRGIYWQYVWLDQDLKKKLGF